MQQQVDLGCVDSTSRVYSGVLCCGLPLCHTFQGSTIVNDQAKELG